MESPVVKAAPRPVRSWPLEFADEENSLRITGFWMFLVTDVLIFASLFSVYAVYQFRTAGGPGPHAIFHLSTVLEETLILLTSSFTISLGIWSMRRGRLSALYVWLVLTMLLGALFVGIELREFASDVAAGAPWSRSAFLSSFFVLVATHGTHVTIGLLWAIGLLGQLIQHGLTSRTARKVYTFALYWHFLDIVWVFIFTYVYLAGRLP